MIPDPNANSQCMGPALPAQHPYQLGRRQPPRHYSLHFISTGNSEGDQQSGMGKLVEAVGQSILIQSGLTGINDIRCKNGYFSHKNTPDRVNLHV